MEELQLSEYVDLEGEDMTEYFKYTEKMRRDHPEKFINSKDPFG